MSGREGMVAFFKYHALGNDFVMVDALQDAGAWGLGVDWARAAPRVCDRHRGVGGDGVLLVTRDDDGADCVMRIINSDGSDGGMCGNGIRCVAKHMIEEHGVVREALRVRVAGRVREVRCEVEQGEMRSARVGMGTPAWAAAEVPCSLGEPQQALVQVAVPVARMKGVAPRMTCVSMGNPHAVIFVDDVAAVDVRGLGRTIEHLACFPQRTNVQFAHVLARDRVRVRTWERGAGNTMACGSGACAVVAAGVRIGVLAASTTVELDGGPLRIEQDATGAMQMTGPATLVARGAMMRELLDALVR